MTDLLQATPKEEELARALANAIDAAESFRVLTDLGRGDGLTWPNALHRIYRDGTERLHAAYDTAGMGDRPQAFLIVPKGGAVYWSVESPVDTEANPTDNAAPGADTPGASGPEECSRYSIEPLPGGDVRLTVYEGARECTLRLTPKFAAEMADNLTAPNKPAPSS